MEKMIDSKYFLIQLKKKKCNQTIVFPILIYLALNLENPALKNRGQIN